MCEFNIKRVDAVNADTDKDRRGCYKRGDIINVQPDGEYVDKPHHTVLVVTGLDHTKVLKFMEVRQEPQEATLYFHKDEWDSLVEEDITQNDVTYTDALNTSRGD